VAFFINIYEEIIYNLQMNIIDRKKIIKFAIDVQPYNFTEEIDMDNILDFLIDNKISMNELLNQISPILDWYDLSNIERMCMNELYEFIYRKIYIKNEKQNI